jgi:hypothetical protein
LISYRSRFAVFERRLFVSARALFGHRQPNGDADIGSRDRRQIDDLPFTEKLLARLDALAGASGFRIGKTPY